MRRSPMPDRKKPMPRSGLRSVGPRDRAAGRGRPKKAMPGPSAVERLVVAVRADFRCELCGLVLGAYDGELVEWSRHREHSFHHRQPRGSGGTRDPLTNTPPRLLLLCGSATSPDGCHTTVESQRAMAYANGWLVKRPTDPATVPVELYAGRVYLAIDGAYQEAS